MNIIGHFSKAAIDRQTFADVDFFELCRYFLPATELNADSVYQWLCRYLTDDPAEIDRRCRMIEELSGIEGALSVLTQIERNNGEINRSLKLLQIRSSRLEYCTITYRVFSLYLESATLFRGLLSGCKSKGLREVLARLDATAELAEFKAMSAAAERLAKSFRPLKSATVAFNFTDGGKLFEMAVVDYRQDDERAAGLLTRGAQPNALLNSARKLTKTEIRHLQQFLVRTYEIKSLFSLNRTRGELKKLSMPLVDEWMEFSAPISYLIAALRYLSVLNANGCTISLPVCLDPKSETKQHGLAAKRMYYPHMALESKDGLPVPYDISIDRAATAIITGANNSGKTSFLKSVAQTMLLAQIGFPVPAEEFVFTPAGTFCSVFSTGEDDRMHQSRFQKEAEALKAILGRADRNYMIFLNEPFTSTSSTEASSLLCEVLTLLLQKGSTLLLVTHLYDVYYLLRENSRVFSYITVTNIVDDKIQYTYHLRREEPDGVRYAKIIAKEFGLDPARFIADAGVLEKVRNYIEANEEVLA